MILMFWGFSSESMWYTDFNKSIIFKNVILLTSVCNLLSTVKSYW